MTVAQADKYFAAIRRIARRFGIGAFLLGASPVLIYIALPLPLIGAAMVVWGWLNLKRFRTVRQESLTLAPLAAEYCEETLAGWRRGRTAAIVVAALAAAAAVIWYLAVPESWSGCVALLALGASLVCHAVLRLRLFRGTRIVVQGENSAGDERIIRAPRTALIALAVYVLVVGGLYVGASLIFENFRMFLYLPIIAALLWLVRLMVNNPFARWAYVKRRHAAVVIASTCGTALVVFAVAGLVLNGTDTFRYYLTLVRPVERPGVSGISYDMDSGVYDLSMPEDGTLTLLQLTDIHLGGSWLSYREDILALEACERLIRQTQPDLVVVTGDLSYPVPLQSFSANNVTTVSAFGQFMNGLGVPWAFVYGNHDTDEFAKYDNSRVDAELWEYSYLNGGMLLYSGTQPEVFGRYNGYIRLLDSDGSVGRLLFLLDSNYQVKGTRDYDGVHADQIEWYADIAGQYDAPSCVFLHYPPLTCAEAWAGIETGEATLLFGETGEALNTSAVDYGLFDRLVSLGSTDAVFFGHDHLNYSGVEYKGIKLVYGMSIDYLAYPGISAMTEQRGGTVLTVRDSGVLEIGQLPLSQTARLE